MIDSLVSNFYIPFNRSRTVHSIQQFPGQSLWLSVSHTVAEMGPMKDEEFCTVQERRCRGLSRPSLWENTALTFPVWAKKDSCLIESYTRFTGSPLSLPSSVSLGFNTATPCSLFPAGCASRPTWAPEGFRTSAHSLDSSSTWWWTRPSKRTSSPPAQSRTSTARP